MNSNANTLVVPPWRPELLKRTVWFVWWTAALLIGLTWFHTFSLIESSRVSKEAETIRDLSNLARVSEEHASRTLRSADQVVRFVKDHYLEKGLRTDLVALAERGVIDTDIFNQFGIIDSNGIYAFANRPITSRIDLSDREHFKVHVAADSGELFVSQPLVGRATQRWSVQLTRRINLTDGGFGGVVVISVDPGYFTRFYGELKLGGQGVAALYGLDGVARARRVGALETHGVNASSSEMFRLIALGQMSGSFSNRSVVDGIERVYFYRKLAGFPLLVVVGRDVSDVFSAHERDKDGFMQQAWVLSALLLLFALAFSRHFWRMREALEKQEATQQQVAERTAQLNAVFTLSPDGLMTFDEHRRVKYESPAVAELLSTAGLSMVGFEERQFHAWLVSRCERGSGPRPLDSTQAGGDQPGSDNQVIILAHPAKRVLQLSARDGGAPSVSRILYIRDITHESEVSRLKSEFLSTAAHELRTPMASVYGFAEVLLAQPDLDPATQKEFLSIIHQQSQNIAAILDELLNLARIEARRGKDFKLAPVDCCQLVLEVLKQYKPPAGRDPVLATLPPDPVWLTADPGKMRQVLLNVLSNAYKFSAQGGDVSLSLDLRAHCAPPHVCIKVTDSGIGMTPQQVKRVCERFFRADTSGKLPGSGLGMAIVKEIMHLHHGTVEVNSVWGVGTTVELCLPLEWEDSLVQSRFAEVPEAENDPEDSRLLSGWSIR